MKHCATCRYFTPARGPTGRPRPSERGTCAYAIPHRPLPAWYNRGHGIPDVWQRSGYDCETYAPSAREVAAQRKTATPMLLEVTP